MSAKDKPVSKPNNQKFNDNFDRIFGKPVGEDTRPKDRVKLGVSPSTKVTEMEVKK